MGGYGKGYLGIISFKIEEVNGSVGIYQDRK
jgi:hypothetical protein